MTNQKKSVSKGEESHNLINESIGKDSANSPANAGDGNVEKTKSEAQDAESEEIQITHTTEVVIPESFNEAEVFAGFDEAEQMQGIGISATGLKLQEGEEKIFLLAKREMISGTDDNGSPREVEALFLLQKDRTQVFTTAAAIMGATKKFGTIEEDQLNYVAIKFLEKVKASKPGRFVNRYEIRLVNPTPKKQAAKQIAQ